MTVSIPTANILLTQDYDAVMTLFSGQGTVTDILAAKKSNKNLFIFNNKSSSNLIRFTSEVGKGRTQGHYTIELIDPPKDFEEFLRPNLPQLLKNEFSNLFETPLDKNLLAVKTISNLLNTRNIKDNLGSQAKVLDLVDKKLRHLTISPFPDIIDKFFIGSDTDKTGKLVFPKNRIDELKLWFSEEFHRSAKYKDEWLGKDLEDIHKFNKITRKENLFNKALFEFNNKLFKSNRYYIAFGIGNNLKRWAGPYSCVLGHADMKITANNLRSIEIGFFVTEGLLVNRRDIHNRKIFLDLQGYGLKNEGRSDPVDILDRVSRKLIDSATKEALAIPPGKDFGEFFIEKAYDAVFSKKKKIIGSSLPVFIDKIDIHSIVVQCIERYLKKIVGTENVIVLLPNINLERREKLFQNFIKYIKRDQTPVEIPYFKGTSHRYKKREETTETFIEESLKELGLRIEKEPKPQYVPFPSHIQNVQRKSPFTLDPFRAVLEANYITEVIQNSEEEGRRKNAIPNWQTPLDRVTEALGKKTDLSESNTLYLESNMKIVEIWAEHIPSKVIDKTKPVALFGHTKFIEQFLYGLYRVGVDELTEAEELYLQLGINLPKFAQNQLILLHPNDTLLNNAVMWDSIKTVMTGDENDILDTPLGDFFNIPANFGVEGFDEFSIETIKTGNRFNIPVFRTNVQNSNILELDISYEKTYLLALQSSIEKAHNFFPALSNADKRALEKNYALKHDWFQLVKTMRQNKINQKDAIQNLKKKFNLTPASDAEVTSFVVGMYALKTLDPAKPVLTVYQEDKVDPVSIQMLMLEATLPKTYEVEVKTLPLFQFSNHYFMKWGCLLLAQQPQIIGVNLKRKAIDSFYSGYYTIVNMEHEISNTEVSSKFTLIKSFDSLSTKDTGDVPPSLLVEADENEVRENVAAESTGNG